MKGLLIKDFKLMKNQIQFFAIIVFICLVFLVFYKSPFFCIGYITIMLSVFTISTISYDEYDNGFAYLFTLPVTRKRYVGEKYVFGLITGTVSLAAISLISYGAFSLRHLTFAGEEWVSSILSSFLLIVFMLALMIPLQFKFGSEKSRIAMIGTFAAAVLIAYLIAKAGAALTVDFDAVFTKLVNSSLPVIALMIMAVCVVMLIISYLAAVKIMEKKEF